MSKKKLFSILLLLIVLVISAIFYAKLDYVGVCPPYRAEGSRECFSFVSNFILLPVLMLSSILIPVTFMKLVFPRIFKTWLTFTIPYSIFAVLVSLSFGGGGGFGIGGPDTEAVAFFFAVLFLILSVILIMASVRVRTKDKK